MIQVPFFRFFLLSLMFIVELTHTQKPGYFINFTGHNLLFTCLHLSFWLDVPTVGTSLRDT